jgi:membrane associated rhomboid family serine protease
VFIPISDENPLRSIRVQWVTIALIAANILIFLLQVSPSGGLYATSFAIVPSELMSTGIFGGAAHGPYDVVAVPESYTLVTYMFLHGDIWHLASNMLFLWVFGDNVEDAVGHLRFLVFYLVCGVMGGLFHAWVATHWMLEGSDKGLIGASGAVAGVIAAYLLLHPHVRLWIVAFRFIPLRLTAAWALGAWIASQFVMAAMPEVGPIAWWAHIGGILTGSVLILFMRRPGVPLLSKGLEL